MAEQHQQVAIVTGAGRGIGAAIAARLGADGMAVACLDIDEASAQETADRLAAPGRDRRRVRRRRQRRGRRRAGGGRGRRPAGGADRAGQQRRGAPRQPAVQDVRQRLGHRDAGAPARHLPDDPGHPAAHDRGVVRPDREPVLDLRARQPRPGELLRGQGRPAGLHQDRRPRARPLRRHLQRRRARLHRHRDDPRHRRAGRAVLRGVQRRPGREHPGQPGRPARGRRRRGVVLLLAALRLRLRPGPVRRRGPRN